ncbi:hypothetical protein HZS55_11260 [Halosimplex rubrum]|uniref:Uncharacterized protein n=1 Tax=Halosimplex rubrum TaxID=869889 RepID=A0A7D5P9R8_9EURY|nr:hypothetical protein [Halosimplex rubrum]QLH77840.1 hypothetical protein HZS55_11260 [Halosimplex rubrum]
MKNVRVRGVDRPARPTRGATFVFVLDFGDAFDREDLDRDHSLAYRLGNRGGAVLAVAVGLVTLAVGIVSVVAAG